MGKQYNYLDLFAGAGGLSEGFIRAGFNPIAHVDMDQAACFTLKTRMAYHWLKENGDLNLYTEYLNGAIDRTEFYNFVPKNVTNSVINTEITEETLPDIFSKIDKLMNNQDIDLIIGGPPCQAYSNIGRSRCPNGMIGDPRNYLYVYYAKFLDKYKPEYFVFENVPGLLSAKDECGESYLEHMRELFREYGYETEYRLLNAKDYGIPQNRKRVLLIGKKGTSIDFYPEPDILELKICVKDILSDLPILSAGEGDVRPCIMNEDYNVWLREVGIRNDGLPVTFHQARKHNERDLEIYKIAVEQWTKKQSILRYNELRKDLKTHKNTESFLNRFKVVAGDLTYSHTIVAHIAKDGHYYIHPDIKQNRSLTPREAARLQTFSDDYYFESSSGKPCRTPAYHQIGNAVPVLLAQKIANNTISNKLYDISGFF